MGWEATGIDMATQSELDAQASVSDFFAPYRSSEVSTMPGLLADSDVILVSTNIYGALAFSRSAITISKMRVCTGSIITSLTFLRGGWWDNTGAKVAETGDLVSTVTLVNTVYDNIPLLAPVTFTAAQAVFGGMGFVGTAFRLAGRVARAGPMNAALGTGPLKTRTATAWAGGALPALTGTTGSTLRLWTEGII